MILTTNLHPRLKVKRLPQSLQGLEKRIISIDVNKIDQNSNEGDLARHMSEQGFQVHGNANLDALANHMAKNVASFYFEAFIEGLEQDNLVSHSEIISVDDVLTTPDGYKISAKEGGKRIEINNPRLGENQGVLERLALLNLGNRRQVITTTFKLGSNPSKVYLNPAKMNSIEHLIGNVNYKLSQSYVTCEDTINEKPRNLEGFLTLHPFNLYFVLNASYDLMKDKAKEIISSNGLSSNFEQNSGLWKGKSHLKRFKDKASADRRLNEFLGTIGGINSKLLPIANSSNLIEDDEDEFSKQLLGLRTNRRDYERALLHKFSRAFTPLEDFGYQEQLDCLDSVLGGMPISEFNDLESLKRNSAREFAIPKCYTNLVSLRLFKAYIGLKDVGFRMTPKDYRSEVNSVVREIYSLTMADPLKEAKITKKTVPGSYQSKQ